MMAFIFIGLICFETCIANEADDALGIFEEVRKGFWYD